MGMITYMITSITTRTGVSTASRLNSPMYFTNVLNIKSLLAIPSQLLLTPSRQFRITATAKFFLSLLPCIYGLINITDYRNTFFNPNQAAVQA